MQQGSLYKNEQGQYALDNEKYLACGDYIEVFDEDLNTWIKGRVEVDGNREYYFVDDEEFMVIYLYDGLLVRA